MILCSAECLENTAVAHILKGMPTDQIFMSRSNQEALTRHGRLCVDRKII